MAAIRDLELNSEELITSITGTTAGKNFELYKSYVMTSLVYPSYLDVNRHKVARTVEGLYEKFLIHSQHLKAERFSSLCQNLLQNPVFKDNGVNDVPFAILALLFELADNPTGTEYDPCPPRTTKLQNVKELLGDDPFRSLREESKFSAASDSDLSDWSDDDDDDMEGNGMENLNQTVQTIPVVRAPCRDVGTQSSGSLQASMVLPGVRRLAPDGTSGRSWLHDHLQFPYWNGISHGGVKRSRTQHLAEQLCTKWKHCISEASYWSFVDTTELSERQIIREILWLLGGSRNGYVIIFDGSSDCCAINAKVQMPHATQDALVEWLSPLTRNAGTLQKLHRFVRKVADGSSEYECSQTYKAYAAALSEWLCKLKSDIAKLEKRFIDQSEMLSISMLMKYLEPWLEKLVLLEGVHHSGIEACEANWPSWTRAAHLLDVLYMSALDIDVSGRASKEEVDLIFSIFLKTMHPYLSIMDSWMSASGLQDPHKEFIIACNEDVSSADEKFWDKVVSVRQLPSKDDRLSSPSAMFLQPVLPALVIIGKSVEILRRLGKLADVHQCGSRETLYHLVIKVFSSLAENYCVSVTSSDRSKSEDTSMPHSVGFSAKGHLSAYLKASLSCLESDEMFDPILSWYFNSEFLDAGKPVVPYSGVAVEEDAFVDRAVHLFVNHAPGQLPDLLQQAFVPIVMDKYAGICSKLFEVLTEEFHFKACLMNFRKYFLMEAGDVMYKFYSRLFSTIPAADLAARESDVDLLLQVIVSASNPEDASDLKILVDESVARVMVDPIHAYDCLHLNYQVPWPLNLVINSNCQKKYNEVFTFLMQIKRAQFALCALHFSELNPTNKGVSALDDRDKACLVVDRERKRKHLYLSRMKLLNFVNCLHDFLMTNILRRMESISGDICNRSSDFQEVVNRHNLYLQIIYEQCLLHRSLAPIKEAIIKILNLALIFHNLWTSEIDCITLDAITQIETHLNECCNFIKWLSKCWMARRSLPYWKSVFNYRSPVIVDTLVVPIISIDEPYTSLPNHLEYLLKITSVGTPNGSTIFQKKSDQLQISNFHHVFGTITKNTLN